MKFFVRGCMGVFGWSNEISLKGLISNVREGQKRVQGKNLKMRTSLKAVAEWISMVDNEEFFLTYFEKENGCNFGF